MKPAFHRGALFTAPVVAAIVLMTWLPGDAIAQESMSLDLDTAVKMATAHNRKAKMLLATVLFRERSQQQI